MDPQGSASPLHSWKEIASFLGVSVRTAQYWEREKGLPVRRLPGERARVFATTEDMQDWRVRAGTSARPFEAVIFWRAYSLAASLALALVAGHNLIEYVGDRSGPPVEFKSESTSLTALDATGRRIWSKGFPESAERETRVGDRAYPRRKLWYGDLNNDGRTEVIYIVVPAEGSKVPRNLFCLSQDGSELWRHNLAPVGGSAGSDTDVVVTDLEVLPGSPDSPTIFVSLCAWPNHRGRLVALDGRGQVVKHLYSTGHLEVLRVLDVDGDGRAELLAGGFDSAKREAMLIVVDSRTIKREATILFPRSCLNRLLGEHNLVRQLGGNGDSVEVQLEEWFEDQPVGITVRLDRKLSRQGTWFSDSFRRLHRLLELDGKLNHGMEKDTETARETGRLPEPLSD